MASLIRWVILEGLSGEFIKDSLISFMLIESEAFFKATEEFSLDWSRDSAAAGFAALKVLSAGEG